MGHGASKTSATLRLTATNTRSGERVAATETPIAVSFLGIGYAVMMARPADLRISQ